MIDWKRTFVSIILATMLSAVVVTLSMLFLASTTIEESFSGATFGGAVLLFLFFLVVSGMVVGLCMLVAGLPAALLAQVIARSPPAGLVVIGLFAAGITSILQDMLGSLFHDFDFAATAPYAITATLVLWAGIYRVVETSPVPERG